MYIGDHGLPVDDTAAVRAREAQDRADRVMQAERIAGVYDGDDMNTIIRGID